MLIYAATPKDYVDALPEDRKSIVEELRQTILNNLPEGFGETTEYGMITYFVPHSIYPPGYHVNPKEPLPFMAIAAQKNHIAVYHMGIYMDEDLLKWFTAEYSKEIPTKLDMGKSCIRFKNPKKIPIELLGKLAQKLTPQEYIKLYEKSIEKK